MKIDIFNCATMEWHSESKYSVVSSSNINMFVKVKSLDNTFLAGFFFVIPGNL